MKSATPFFILMAVELSNHISSPGRSKLPARMNTTTTVSIAMVIQTCNFFSLRLKTPISSISVIVSSIASNINGVYDKTLFPFCVIDYLYPYAAYLSLFRDVTTMFPVNFFTRVSSKDAVLSAS